MLQMCSGKVPSTINRFNDSITCTLIIACTLCFMQRINLWIVSCGTNAHSWCNATLSSSFDESYVQECPTGVHWGWDPDWKLATKEMLWPPAEEIPPQSLPLWGRALSCMHTGARCSSVVRAFAHGAMGRRIDPSWSGPIELFLVPGRGMCYLVCWMVHIKGPLLLIGKSSPCDGSGFPLSLSQWFFIICLTPYNRN